MKITGDIYKQFEKLIGDTIGCYTLSELNRHLDRIKSDVDVCSVGTRFIWDIYYSINRDKWLEWDDIVHLHGYKTSHITTALKQAVPKFYPAIAEYLAEVKE